MGLFDWLRDKWREEGEKDVCGVGFFRDRCDSRLTPACAIHDIEYKKKEAGTQTKTRKQVDDEFLANMMAVVRKQKSIASREWLRAKAMCWYSLVRSLGWIAWYT